MAAETFPTSANGDASSDLVVGDNNAFAVALSSGGALDMSGTGTWHTGWSTAAKYKGLGDFNGDGRDDLIVGDNGSYAVALSDGTKFGAPGTGTWKTGWSTNAPFKGVGDFNGDGRDDLVVGDANVYAVALSSGTALGAAGTGSWLTGWSTNAAFKGVGDFNGDGADDLIVGDNATYAVATSDRTKFGGAYTGVWRTGWSTSAAFIGVTHGSRSVVSPSSYRYGGADRAVNTDIEKDQVIDAMRARSDADALTLYNGLAPADQGPVRDRANARFSSSVTYGGTNWKMDATSEADRFVSDFRGASSDAAANGLYLGLDPADRGSADSALARGAFDGAIYRDVANGQVWEYELGSKAWVTSVDAATQNGYDLAEAMRATGSSLAGVPTAANINYYPPSEEDGGGDDADLEALGTRQSSDGRIGKVYQCINAGGTIRNAGGRFSIGTCWHNASITITGKQWYNNDPSAGQRWYYKGAIGGNFMECGFLQGLANTQAGGTRIDVGCGSRGIPENVFASQMYDSPKELRRQGRTFNGGYNPSPHDNNQDEQLKSASALRQLFPDFNGACPRYANVDFISGGNAKPEERIPGGNVAGGDWAQVRYLTRGGDYFMARYPAASSGSTVRKNAWAFMPRTCFVKRPEIHTTPSSSQPAH
ncbi:MAG: VCBS repeat-containing protein [Solirubrobacteraceae bacterium]|nr:VCBS repeat-containing protein [Solirubrobacteraceae bacterium]